MKTIFVYENNICIYNIHTKTTFIYENNIHIYNIHMKTTFTYKTTFIYMKTTFIQWTKINKNCPHNVAVCRVT